MRDREASLSQHLRELRFRLIVSLLTVLVASAVAFPFWERIIYLLLLPTGHSGSFVAIEVTETLTTSVKISFWCGFLVAFPVVLYQALRFVMPALTGSERRYLLIFLPAAMLAFACGVAFAYFVLAPPAFKFLLSLGSDIIEIQPRISNVVNVMIRLLFWMGLAFETPLVIFLLAQLGIVTGRGLSRFRRFWLVIAFLLAAIITPTFDPLNQSLVAVPLLVLYEVGVLLARIAARGRETSSGAPRPLSPAE